MIVIFFIKNKIKKEGSRHFIGSDIFVVEADNWLVGEETSTVPHAGSLRSQPKAGNGRRKFLTSVHYNGRWQEADPLPRATQASLLCLLGYRIPTCITPCQHSRTGCPGSARLSAAFGGFRQRLSCRIARRIARARISWLVNESLHGGNYPMAESPREPCDSVASFRSGDQI